MPLAPMIRLAIKCGNEPYADDHICQVCDDAIADVTIIAKGQRDRHLCRPCHDGHKPNTLIAAHSAAEDYHAEMGRALRLADEIASLRADIINPLWRDERDEFMAELADTATKYAEAIARAQMLLAKMPAVWASAVTMVPLKKGSP